MALNKLELLRIFCSAAELGNFKACAVKLALSPQAVTRAVLLEFVVAATHREHGVVAEIGLEDAIEKGLLGTAVVHEVLAIRVRGHHTSTQLAVESQRAGDVDLVSIVVPRASRGI